MWGSIFVHMCLDRKGRTLQDSSTGLASNSGLSNETPQRISVRSMIFLFTKKGKPQNSPYFLEGKPPNSTFFFRGINGGMFIPFHIESSPVHSITQLTAPTHHALVDLGDPVCTSQWRPGRLVDVLGPTKSTSGVFRSRESYSKNICN